jgi:hypothetical protein
MGRTKGSKNRSTEQQSLDKKLINDLEEVFQMNTDNEPEQEPNENEFVVIGLNEIFRMDFDKDENVVVANGNALVDGHGADTEVLLLLSPKQITQLYHFCNMELHKHEWEKTMR